LPAENPENLAFPWKAAAPRGEAAPADPVLAGWRATTQASDPPPPQTTGSIRREIKPKEQVRGRLIQAGSFKSKENADRAREALSAIAPVDVSEIAVGADVYFRVRIGPFADVSEAQTALAKVTKAGYAGAKMVAKN
jgi:cell division protein FtsN